MRSRSFTLEARRQSRLVAAGASERDDQAYIDTISLMVDKVTTVATSKLQTRVGKLAEAEMTRLSQAVLVFLGLSR